ncbi:unnamed protein product, partial [Larinioides sclopetarius]
MPDCRDKKDKCQCHPSYTEYKDDRYKQPRNCLKMGSKKRSWDAANYRCADELSVLADYKIPKSLFEDFRKRGVNLVWIGIKKRLEFYTVRAPMEYVFKAWNNSERAPDWEEGEPIHECVAMNISSGLLVTRDCDTELEYVCLNFGFPVYPVSKSLACPKKWLLFYQRQFGKLNCIRLFKTLGRNTTAACLEQRSQVTDLQEFLDFYSYMSQLNISGYGLKDPKSSCDTKRIESIFGDHFNENLTCIDDIFICERSRRRISLEPKILPDFSDAADRLLIGQKSLTCEVPLKGRNFREVKDQLHYVWYKEEVPITVDSRTLQLGSYP